MWEYKCNCVKGTLERIEDIDNRECDCNLEISDFSVSTIRAVVNMNLSDGARKFFIDIEGTYRYIFTVEFLADNVHPDNVVNVVDNIINQIDIDIFEDKGSIVKRNVEGLVSRIFSKLGIERAIKVVDAPQYVSSNSRKQKEVDESGNNSNSSSTSSVCEKEENEPVLIDSTSTSYNKDNYDKSNEAKKMIEIIYDNGIDNIDNL